MISYLYYNKCVEIEKKKPSVLEDHSYEIVEAATFSVATRVMMVNGWSAGQVVQGKLKLCVDLSLHSLELNCSARSSRSIL